MIVFGSIFTFIFSSVYWRINMLIKIKIIAHLLLAVPSVL